MANKKYCPFTNEDCDEENCGVWSQDSNCCSFAKLDSIAKSLYMLSKCMRTEKGFIKKQR
jgi:hypothetical protein